MASVSADGAPAAQSAFAITVFDEFARAGMRDVVVCPGSRSTPLVLAALATPSLQVHVRLDERSAGFFAIGRTLCTGLATGVVVTSGTAAAELTAAVVEADAVGVPLVIVTADRPPELRGVGAPQTIDQVKLFGSTVRRFEDPGVPRPGTEGLWRAIASRVVASAVVGRGPVHLNVPLVEPLDAAPSDVPAGRRDGAPWRRVVPVAGVVARHEVLGTGRVLVVAGRGAGGADVLLAASDAHGWPVLADALSGARTGHRTVVAGFDALVSDPALRERLRPDVVLALGAPPAARALGDALAAWSPRVVAVAQDGWPHDPRGLVSDVVVAPPAEWLASMAEVSGLTGDAAYLGAWRAADDAVQRVFDEGCATELTEPAVARALTQLAGGVPLVVSSSMPIRDVDAFGASTAPAVRVLANRGANGIDGVVSTALGVAAGGHSIALLGDLAFLHDAGALADGVGEAGGTCVLVVVDNHGGGIFSFLPQRASLSKATFERAFGTPPTASVASVALGYGTAVHEVKDLDGLRGAVGTGLRAGGVTVVVAAVPDRERNVELHRALTARAQHAALAALGG